MNEQYMHPEQEPHTHITTFEGEGVGLELSTETFLRIKETMNALFEDTNRATSLVTFGQTHPFREVALQDLSEVKAEDGSRRQVDDDEIVGTRISFDAEAAVPEEVEIVRLEGIGPILAGIEHNPESPLGRSHYVRFSKRSDLSGVLCVGVLWLTAEQTIKAEAEFSAPQIAQTSHSFEMLGFASKLGLSAAWQKAMLERGNRVTVKAPLREKMALELLTGINKFIDQQS